MNNSSQQLSLFAEPIKEEVKVEEKPVVEENKPVEPAPAPIVKEVIREIILEVPVPGLPLHH